MTPRKFPTISSFIAYLQAAARHFGVRTDLPAWEEAQRLSVGLYGVAHVNQNPAIVDYACLAVSSLDEPLVMKLDPELARRASTSSPLKLPPRPPRMLRGAWIIEAQHPEAGELLFANTASLGGYVAASGKLMLIGMLEPNGGGHIVGWDPPWGTSDPTRGVRPEISGLIADSAAHYAWARQAAQFVLGWALLMEQPDAPIRMEVEGAAQRPESTVWN